MIVQVVYANTSIVEKHGSLNDAKTAVRLLYPDAKFVDRSEAQMGVEIAIDLVAVAVLVYCPMCE